MSDVMNSESTTTRRLTLLGTGTSMGVPMIGCHCDVCASTNPRNHRNRAGAVVTTPAGNFLIDTPPELRLQLIREGIDMVEAVVFTHAHADHILGLDDLRIFGYKLKRPVMLYSEEPVEAALRQTFAYAFTEKSPDDLHSRPALEFCRIGLAPFEVLGIELIPFRLEHGGTDVLGFRMGDVAYATDCNRVSDESRRRLQGLDVLILDALWDEPHPTHFCVSEALEVIEQLQPKRAYLTHISHKLEYEATNARLPDNVELAYDGLSIPF